jgi:hypothetical protein
MYQEKTHALELPGCMLPITYIDGKCNLTQAEVYGCLGRLPLPIVRVVHLVSIV